MIAYDSIKLKHLLVTEQAKKYKRLNLISEQELGAIAVANQPSYHRTNIFIRAGVLALTVILAFCSCGLITLFFHLDSEFAFKGALLFFTALSILLLEHFIRKKNQFASGIDDGLLYFALGAFMTFIGFLIGVDSSFELMFFYFSIFLFSSALTIRYADAVTTTISLFTLLATVFFFTIQTGPISKLIMPFVMMLLSGLIYYFCLVFTRNHNYWIWENCFSVVKFFSLICFYASGNYFIVREAGIEFFDMQILPGQDIPLSIFFYVFTAVIPVVYIYSGIVKKNYTLLNCGLLAAAASIATFRYYFSIAPIEIALIAGGVLLLVITGLTYRVLKVPVNGITTAEDTSSAPWFSKDVEAIIIAQAAAHQAAIKPADESMFGDGKFGGGGAGEKF